MTYSTLAQFKAYLWIDPSDTSKDTTLTLILDSANSKLNHLCWVDSFAKWEYTQLIEKRWIYEAYDRLEFYLKNKPVSQIKELNGIVYEWVKGDDYLVIYDRRICLKKVQLNSWDMLTIKYEAWYETIPDDLKLMEMMLGSWIYQSDWFEWISSYKLWDESITFWSRAWNYGMITPDDQYFSFTVLLNKYKNFNLPI